jgi:hypothetical protein
MCDCNNLRREYWNNVTWLECNDCGTHWDTMEISHVPTFCLLCRLERPATGSTMDIEINLLGPRAEAEKMVESVLSMVHPGWDLVSHCPA